MLYRILDLRYSKLKGGIDDEPLQRLLHGHEVLSRTERLYHQEGEPHLLVSVLYCIVIWRYEFIAVADLREGVEKLAALHQRGKGSGERKVMTMADGR